jgi:diguanylate cyclase (GGDEF)-like protein
MVDIDHFKAINDRHGHQTGDHVLIHFARTLAEHLREVDVVGRWGGEEFLVLLPDTRAGEAEQAAERMRGAIAAGPGFAQGQPVTCTASFGVGEFDPRELSFDCLLDRVDAALYRAKIAGRNRVERAAPLVPADSET